MSKGIRVEAQITLHEWLNNSIYFDNDERNKAEYIRINPNALDDKNVNEDAEQQMEIFKKYTLLLDENVTQVLKNNYQTVEQTKVEITNKKYLYAIGAIHGWQ